ncbi:hypothetical protein [uncultured Campylobacter sp.]|nr:hypothetical protein [uncultured Campylobacter sp.]
MNIKTQNDAAFCAGYEYGMYEIAEQAVSIDAPRNFYRILPIVARGFI